MKNKRTINNPNPFASNEEKEGKEYGLEYARYIESEWITNGKYSSRKREFEELEALRNNDVDIDKFKNMLNIPKDKAWVSLNWEFTSIVPKFVNVVKDSFPVDMFKIKTKGVDVMSQKERSAYRRNLETEMLTRDFTSEMTTATGINFMPDYVPESEEELDLHMMLKYRQKKELASEIIINRIFDLNYYREIQNRIAEDLTTNGMAALRVNADPNYGVTLNRVDCKNFVFSFDPMYTRDKKGSYYFAEIMQMTPSEIYRVSGGEVTRDTLSKSITDRRFFDAEKEGDDEVFTVMYFTFKTTLDDVYKRKRNKLIPKGRDFELPENSRSRVIRGSYDVWFEGYYLLGTDVVFNYGMMKDMVRPVDDPNSVLPPYVTYQLTVPSIVKNLKPFAEDVHLTVLKLRHLISKLRPDGYEINVDALSNINIGTGSTLPPAEVLEIYDQNGYLLFKGSPFDDDQNFVGNVMKSIPTNDGQKLAQLINIYNHNVNMCYEVTGVNRVRDGSAPLSGALVGTQQMALNMSNTATKHIMEGLLSIKKQGAEVTLNRAQQMSMYHDNMASDVMDYLLEDDLLKDYETLYKHKLDVIVELKPDAEEQAKFDQVVLASVQNGAITLSDRIDIMSIDNLKMASAYLKIIIKKRQDEAYMKQKEMEAMKIQMQAQAQQSVEQQKQQSLAMELQVKSELARMEGETSMALKKTEIEGQIMLEQLKHKNRMEELGLQARVSMQDAEFKEDRKDNRTRIQAQQQSQMINQRQSGGSPVPFESMDRMNDIPGAAPRVEIPDMNEVNKREDYGTTEEEGQSL